MKDNSILSRTIEWLRFFCIGLVVLLHAENPPINGNTVLSYQHGAYDTIQILFSESLCRIAVPILFLISGYLFFRRLEDWNTDVWIEKLKRRISTLLLPYIIWNFIPICLSFIKFCAQYYIGEGDTPSLAVWYSNIGSLKSFWNMGGGYPINYPLWFIRDLIVFIILSPIVYYFIKRAGVIGLVILYFAYFFNIWGPVPGLSVEGFFFFALGSFFSIRGIDFTAFFKKHWVAALCVSCPLVVSMALTFGNYPSTWMYTRRIFTLFGASCTIGIAALLIQKQRIKVNRLLSKSAFFIFAAHGTIMLPIVQSALGKALPDSQAGLIIRYLMAPVATIALLVLCYFFLSKILPKTTAVLTGGR